MSIGETAFSENKLTSVMIPASVEHISMLAFMAQFAELSNDPLMAVGNSRYVALYTEDPSNPRGFQDDVMYYSVPEELVDDDINSDGDLDDLYEVHYGGHLVNPARITSSYKNSQGAILKPSLLAYGVKSDGLPILDLSVNNGPKLPSLVFEEESVTPESLQAQRDALAMSYYRIGAQATVRAPTIAGYGATSPASPHTLTLAGRDNALGFIYARNAVVSPPAPVVSVDFGNTPGGLGSSDTSSPGVSAPIGVHDFLTRSVLSVDTAAECNTVASAKLVKDTPLSLPADYVNLGGVGFTLDCRETGGSANLTWQLGTQLDPADVDKVRVLKSLPDGSVRDITDIVSVSNQSTTNGVRTILRYTIQDGASLDDDGIANGMITDPVYVALPRSIAAPDTGSVGQLVRTLSPAAVGTVLAGTAAVLVALSVSGYMALKSMRSKRRFSR